MAILSTSRSNRYTASGGTTFTANFPFFETGDVGVYADGVLVDPADYTVSGTKTDDWGYENGADFIFDTAPANGVQIDLISETSNTQPDPFQANGAIPPKQAEKLWDRCVILIQQVKQLIGNSIQYSATEPAGFVTEIPDIESRKNKVLAFNGITGALEVADKAEKGDKGDTGDTGAGVPSGGTEGQIIAKTASSSQWDWVKTVYQEVAKTAHGIAVNKVVRGDDSNLALAQSTASSSAMKNVRGIVHTVVDADNLLVVSHGLMPFTGAVAGTEYFVSDSVAGNITGTKPSNPNYVKRIGYSPADDYLFVEISEFEVLEAA